MKTFIQVMTLLHVMLVLLTSCSKEPIALPPTDFNTEVSATAAKSHLSHLSISNDDDSFTEIFTYDNNGHPVLGLIVEITNSSNTYIAISNTHGKASFGTIQAGDYSLTIKNGSTVLGVESVEKLSSNDFAVELSN